MAEYCICCGKKLGIMSGFKALDNGKYVCTNCFSFIAEPYGRFFAAVNNGEYDKAETIYNEELYQIVSKTDYSDETKWYILSGCKKSLNEKIEKKREAEEENKQKEFEQKNRLIIDENIVQLRKEFLMTTGYSFEDYEICEYLGIVSGSIVKGTGFLSELEANLGDIMGTQSDLFSSKLEQARKLAIDKLRDNAIYLGANALIGVDVDYITFSNNMIGVIANGTAVKVNKK